MSLYLLNNDNSGQPKPESHQGAGAQTVPEQHRTTAEGKSIITHQFVTNTAKIRAVRSIQKKIQTKI